MKRVFKRTATLIDEMERSNKTLINTDMIPIKIEQNSSIYNICEDDIKKKAEEISLKYNGKTSKKKLFVSVQNDSEIKVSFKCKRNHNFWASLKDALELWCPMCKKQHIEATKLATKFGWKFNGISIDGIVTFSCPKNHLISSNITQIRGLRCCRICKAQMKIEHNKAEKLNNEELDREKAKAQEELFEAAKKYIETNNTHVPPINDTLNFHCEIKGSNELILEIINTPKEALFSKIPIKARKKYYKNVLQSIHPDKCNHPMATQSLQKFIDAYKNLVIS